MLPTVSKYTNLEIDFSYNGAWEAHIRKLIQNCKNVNHLHSIISKRNIKALFAIRR